MKHLKLFFACLLMAVLSIGQVWAEDETLSCTAGTVSSNTMTFSSEHFTFVHAKGDGSSFASYSPWRVYGKNTVKITAGSGVASIDKIEIVHSGTNYGTLTSTSGTVTMATTSGGTTKIDETSGTEITITNSGSSQSRWSSVKVYYTASGGASTCATPTFSPKAGSYEGTQNVTISSTTGATIYYTDDNSDPKTSATKKTYLAAIPVAADMTIKAYAVKDGLSDSEVATAAYTITEGPDVTINLLDEGWGFPTTKVVEETAYTYGGYTIKVAGSTGNGFRTYGTYFMLGQIGAYLELPVFTSPIEKIVVAGNGSGSGDVAWNIYQGETAVSTAASGCKNDAYTFNIAPANQKANVAHAIKVTNAKNLQIKTIKIYFGEAAAVDAPTISGEANFVTSTTVTLTHADAEAIYYTTDGSDPKTSGTKQTYSVPFTVNADGTTTVKAYAVKGSDESAVAEKTFTKVTALSTMAEVQAEAAAEEKAINVAISNWVVTAVSGSQVWITDADNEKGILLYKSGHGFTAGKKLNGTVVGTKIKLYNLYPELTSLVASEVTVTDADAVSPRTTTIAALTSGHPAEQGTVVKLENVTYSSSVLSDGVNSIAADNKLFSSLALVEGTTYDITGVVEYLDGSVVKIMPRSADDVEAKSAVVTPTAANLAALKAAERGTYILTLTNAVVTYVNGNNAFIEDATGGALIYFASHGYSAGDCLNGDYQVTTTDYQGKFEITAMEPQAGAVKTTAEIPLTTVSIATLNADFAAYESKRIKIAGANVTDAISGSDRNGAINDGAALAVYAAVASTITLTKDDNVDIIGYPGFHNTDQQLTVWAQADITVNEKDPAGIAFDPASATITAGDAWSAPDFANPNSLDVTFSSDDESVATVSNAGVVALAGGYGTAVITAHTDGDATHNAGNATYTVTVNDPASVDTRKVANSPAAFTTTSGNLNPADITYASYQGGSSTAPAIYNDGIRLYQIGGSNDFGGFVTITAKTGCTIDEVQITTTSKYATTVAYSVDGNETLSGSESVAKSGSYTTGTGLNVSSVNILNLGTGSDGRLEIASIKVYYTGEAATIDHYELGGTYQTAFMQDEEFNHTGLIVYAVYDALGENKVDITSMCTFSEPDMSTTGEKTIEITYNEAVVKSYTINVNADSRKVAESPATFTTVSGDMTPNDITFASDQGGASTAPANYNDGIRLYQAPSADAIGGFITLKAKKGCTIDQVKITTTNTYATTVAYSIDGNENLLGSESVAKSSDYSTPSGLNVESVNIVNKGTGSSGRLEIASIKVWYTGDPLAVDHYILGGTYATEFEQYGEFNYEGLTVTAAYDAGETITEAVVGFTVEADLNTAGNKKAEVMLNSVKIAEYDITVTASAKEDPALAYSPASVILTLGDALSAPTFSNTHNVSPIIYSSDKESVATVDAEGNIALAGGCGVAVITASFAENDDYIASGATFTITVNEPAEDLSGTWVLATSVAAGDKIIIGATYQDATKSMGAQNGNNRLAVASTLDAGVLSPGEGTKVFTLVDAGDGKFAIQALNGNYLSAAGTGTSNYLKEAADYTADNAKWSISIDGEGVASVVALSENRNAMQYNSGSTLFSCYASVTSQRPINIYKKGTPTPVYTEVRSGLEAGRHYTVCLEKKVTAVKGATFWSLTYKNSENTAAYLVQEEAPFAAGTPYIIQATDDNEGKLEVVYEGSEVGAPVENGALRGTFSYMDADALAAVEGTVYMLFNNELCPIGTNNHLDAHRAYVLYNLLTVPSGPNFAPGKKVKSMPLQKDVTTGFENLNASEKPVKLMIDGNIYILRGEKLYDATGRLVK